MEYILLVLLGVGVWFLMAARENSWKAPPPRPRKSSSQTRAEKRSYSFDRSRTKPSVEGQVVSGRAYVVDGDTIVIKKTQIRLFGIDAPEMNHPFGVKSKWAMVALCKGQTIRAQITEQDTYGRTVAKCFLPDGRDLSAELVKIGLAIDWTKFSGGIYRHLEVPDARKKMWLADARQKGRMHVWEQFEARQQNRSSGR